MAENNPILKMFGICKTFPGVKALQNVDFMLRAGEVHCLMGENGAGKSTLIKVLTGVEKLDKGEIFLDGENILPKTPLEAQAVGISTVYQEVNLCPNLSVAENMFIGREPITAGRINWKEINKRAEAALEKLNVKIDVTQTLDSYSVAIQQMVAIARSLDVSAKVLILDEPTSSLDKNEVDKLFEVLRKLKKDGIGIIFITHFLDQVYEISDRITVLRNGELVGEFETAALPRVQLVAKMIGKEFDELASLNKGNVAVANIEDDTSFIKARGLGSSGTIKPFDLDIKKGEVLGLVGLLGSGRTETARVLFGADKADSGELFINNRKVSMTSPIDAIKQGMAFCPEDRKKEGIIGDLTVRENIMLALQAKRGMGKYITRKEQEQLADKFIKLLSIKTAGPEQLIKNLSGGNQQKVILARWLATEPDLLILDEPTRGIDVGTKTEIQKLVVKLAEEGMAVVFISSELDEELRTCSRMAVFRDRQKIAELTGDDLTEHYVMQTIAGGQNDAE
ncbi:MAG: sugar ABC transporter ATP-binding protein [Clostridia bacterium]|nr:sugar ABC transporter ATP-binding protein [Clostridia bacterium]